MKQLTLILGLCFAMLAHAEDANTKSGSVNDIAAKPQEHLGPVAITGVVAAVTPGKGFILVDKREYDACGISCLYEKGTNKVPVQWIGSAPKVESHVRVLGTLSKTDKGLSFAAEKIIEGTTK